MRLSAILVVLMYMCVSVWGDIYMHNPRGSNNRLDEQTRKRRQPNRLFDSQNNKRGGYNVGGDGNRVADPMKYMVGSKLRVEWTNQHECGQDKTDCNLIIQYMCAPHLRDGTQTDRIQINRQLNDNADQTRGQHETQRWYADCQTRERNKGLYAGDQDLQGHSTKFTRQNPNGGRNGLECPEERDYYPYWGPTEWKDVAILTKDLNRCKEWAKESQNVKPRSYCRMKLSALLSIANDLVNENVKDDDIAPLDQIECQEKGDKYEWHTAPAFNVPEPECITPPISRDNQNGNTYVPGKEGSDKIPQTSFFDWTIPDDVNPRCALRLRYNISISDYLPFGVNNVDDTPPNSNSRGAISRIPIGETYGMDRQESVDRGYEMQNNPQIKPLSLGGRVQDDLVLELAINTAQTGRGFQDRSHRFSIIPRDPKIPADATIYNLNVRGKRGNIVQTYPAVEYDFVPNDLVLQQNDYVHPQWTGSLRNPANNDGEGTKREDKNNIINLKQRSFGGAQPNDKTGWPGNSYPQNINEGTFLNLGRDFAIQAALPQTIETNKVNENGQLALSCDSFEILSIASAVYGKINIGCDAANSYLIVKERCNGKRSCTVPATNAVFGDPCPGTGKELEVRSTCIQGSPAGDVAAAAMRCRGQDDNCCSPQTPCADKEGDCDKDADCASGHRCGTDNCPWGDNDDCCFALSAAVQAMRCNGQDSGCCTPNTPCKLGEGDCDRDADCEGDMRCSQNLNNCPWGDGDDCCIAGPGGAKSAAVAGAAPAQSIEKKVNENRRLDIRCNNANDRLSIVSAVYGKQSRNCAARSSLSVVRRLCKGKRSCSVYANNKVFGDPCYGTFKELKVSYACVPGSGRDEMIVLNDTYAVANDMKSLDDVLLELKDEMEELTDTLTKMKKNRKDVTNFENDDMTEIEKTDDEEEFAETDYVMQDPQTTRRRRRSRSDSRVALLNKAHYYVDLEPRQAATCGRWHIMCTRNNNFSNRSEKGRVTVECPPK